METTIQNQKNFTISVNAEYHGNVTCCILSIYRLYGRARYENRRPLARQLCRWHLERSRPRKVAVYHSDTDSIKAYFYR